jgi:hypothetical protein
VTVRELRQAFAHHSNTIFFVGGFLFDLMTLGRIDSWLDLLLQSLYLFGITFLVIQRVRADNGIWKPTGRVARLWEFETEALHFFYGGLLSAYVIFYFRSATTSRSFIFLLIVVVMMFANEMPQLRRAGSIMRLGLYAFCVASYLNYLIPVLIGRMGVWVFTLAIVLSAGASAWVVNRIAQLTPHPAAARRRLGWAPALVQTALVLLYAFRWIPPVPLSLQYVGIFHDVQRDGTDYRLIYRKPAWYRFWRQDDRPFVARPGESLYCFVRIFAPRRFRHQVYVRWLEKHPVSGKWMKTDRIPLPVTGGRGEGFRGFVRKSNYQPGRWRIYVETEDERLIGTLGFTVRQDDDTSFQPSWKEARM